MMGSEKLLKTLDRVCISTLTELLKFSGMLPTPARSKETKNNLNSRSFKYNLVNDLLQLPNSV